MDLMAQHIQRGILSRASKPLTYAYSDNIDNEILGWVLAQRDLNLNVSVENAQAYHYMFWRYGLKYEIDFTYEINVIDFIYAIVFYICYYRSSRRRSDIRIWLYEWLGWKLFFSRLTRVCEYLRCTNTCGYYGIYNVCSSIDYPPLMRLVKMLADSKVGELKRMKFNIKI